MSIILVDGNSMGYAHHNAKKLTVGTFQTQAIFGVIKATRALLERNHNWTILFLWDGRSEWRREIYPDYKGNRGPKDVKSQAHTDAYKAQSPFIQKSLTHLGIRQLLVKTAEADDMAGLISKQMSAQGKKVKLITGDQDWIQLVNENVFWYDPINDRGVRLNNFKEFTGYANTLQFLQAKAMVGDISDNIKGIHRFGPVAANAILTEFGTVEEYFAACDSGAVAPRLKTNQSLASPEGREIFYRNMKLMSLLNVPKPKGEDVIVMKPDYDEHKIRLIFEKFGFISMMKDYERFIKPFRANLALAA